MSNILRHKNKTAVNNGQVMVVSAIFFLVATTMIMAGISSSVITEIQNIGESTRSKQSYFAAESLVEDLGYRLIGGLSVSSPEETLVVNGSVATATVATVGADEQEVRARGDLARAIRIIKLRLSLGVGASFNFGVQAGDGGFQLDNSSLIIGNAFSNGPVIGNNSNEIRGDVVAAGPTGLIDGVTATGTAYAHTITDSTIGGDARYQVISGSTVSGTLYPGSPDQATSSLPITDAMVAVWEADAASGGTLSCSDGSKHVIQTNVTIGPVKIPCDLEIKGSPTVTLAGAIWVTGNIKIQNSPDIKISPAIGNRSVPFIADNPSNQLSSSKIVLQNSAEFFGSGSTTSYILLLSQNKSAETGGGDKAIEVNNSAEGALLIYAGHGEILLQNSVELVEVTGYKIHTQNSAKVVYDTGLSNMLFVSGPTGGYTFISWKEAQ